MLPLTPWLFAAAVSGAAPCDDLCPEGTNRVDITFHDIIVDGTFAVESEGCFAFCEPVFVCQFPNVPVVTNNVFTCQPVEGFATIPATVDVDTRFGDAWGPLIPAVVTTIPGSFAAVAIGDVDGDLAEDLVLASGYAIEVRFSNGDGTFSDPLPTGMIDYLLMEMVAGDFNGDQRADIAIQSGGLFAPNTLTIHLGDGLGGFDAGTVIDSDMSQLRLATDLDGDGLDDLVMAFEGGRVAFSDGGVAFTSVDLPAAPWGLQQVHLVPMDFDGDGDLDMAASGEGGSIFPLNGRSFGAPITNASGYGGLSAVAAANVDGDAAEELLVYEGGWGRFRPHDYEQGGFVPLDYTIQVETSAFGDRRGDMDGDGFPDSVGAAAAGCGFLTTSFGSPTSYARPTGGASWHGAIDVDGDGLYEGLQVEAVNVGGDGRIEVVYP